MLGEVIVLCGFQLFADALPIPIRKVPSALLADKYILDKPEDMVVGSRQSDDGEPASDDGYFRSISKPSQSYRVDFREHFI